MTLPVGLALPTTPELTRPPALARLARADSNSATRICG